MITVSVTGRSVVENLWGREMSNSKKQVDPPPVQSGRRRRVRLLSREEAKELMTRLSRNEHISTDEMNDLKFFISEVMGGAWPI